ncbi:hypothetical protein Tco_1030288 [Tanacetum coccineum]|uniref:Uncharacterized protein n=1 Tax=Tanacetum coccineum TaxID=301880 RepID=A0ABQ5G820_9ASTR
MVELRKRKKSNPDVASSSKSAPVEVAPTMEETDGWTVVMLAKATRQKYKVKVAPPKDQQISTISTTPSEIPKRLYDLIQKVAKLNESVKLNSNNSDPEIAFMPHVSKPPTPLKPKPKPKPKMKKKKKIKITYMATHKRTRKEEYHKTTLQSAGVRNRTSKPQNQDPNGQNLPLYARKLQSKNRDDPTVQTPRIDETLLLGFG